MNTTHPSALATRLIIGLAVCGLLGGASASARGATGESSSVRLSLIDSGLERVPFGGDLDEVMTWVRARLQLEYGPRLRKALDASERADIRDRMEDRLEGIRDSVAHFDGRRTGYEVSIVAGEFVAGAEESLLPFREGGVEHYLFFTHGKLWKYARSLPVEGESFEHRYERFVSDHGRPQDVVEKDARGGGVSAATWIGPEVRMHLEDRRLMYRADLLVVEDRAQAEKIAELRGGRAPREGGSEVDPDLEGFLE
ncbi:MAG: hypothetical protein ACQEXJ_08410 [Myxococcota bacterium]